MGKGIEPLILFAAATICVLILKNAEEGSEKKKTDSHYLQLAQQYRQELKAPQQSHFRVVAILLLEDGTLIYGTNDEPSPNISLALCAERCAFLRYRAQEQSSPVSTVYIVTDADVQVAPGTACREFMFGHPATTPQTRVVLQSRDSNSKVSCYTLAELIPYPSIFVDRTPQQQLNWGQTHQSAIHKQMENLRLPGVLSRHNIKKLIQAAQDATRLDDRESVHAIRYGAAIALEVNGATEILHAFQVKALEYSSTQDAVCQMSSTLLQKIQSNPGSARVIAVIQVDQFGIPHGLFAPARAFFVEHGFGDCSVILTKLDEEGTPKLTTATARELSPLVPEFR